MNTVKGNQVETSADMSRIIIRWAVRETMGLVMMGVILFLSSGRLNWIMGWGLLMVMAAWIVATGLVIIPRYPQLLADRVSPPKGAKRWDTVIMGIAGGLTVAGYVVAGLDLRFGWTKGMPWVLPAAALLLTVVGYSIVVWATASNAFFSMAVRIQKERGHTVATGGPYRFVRHPGNAGMILQFLGSPIVLGSWWAGLIGLACALLILLRTALEDRTLGEELTGYKEYAAQVRYRLVPGIW
jgi:protein-S-isoprenylcysteine O-methyltransferase Ste14